MKTQTTVGVINAASGSTLKPSSTALGGTGADSVSSPLQHNSNVLTTTTTTTTMIEQHCRFLEEENQTLKDSQARLQQQCADAQRRERILTRKLSNKEQELQEYVSRISEYKSAQAPGPAALRSALLDPAVNLLFEKLKKELHATKAKLEETQNELSAWKFTPDSNTGKRLMAKCRLLYQENEELGKMTSNGRLAKLEGELAMLKNFSEEVKKSQSELDDFLQELDEDVEGMQSTIIFLQQELKATRDRIQYLEKENFQLKSTIVDDPDDTSMHLVVNGKVQQQMTTILPSIKEHNETAISDNFHNEEQTLNISNNYSSSNLDESCLRTNISNKTSEFHNGNEKNGADETTATNNNAESNNSDDRNVLNLRKRNYDSDSSASGSTNGAAVVGPAIRVSKKLKKRSRRSSVLSIDLNEEDTKIATEQSDEDNSNHKIITRRKSARNHQNGGDNN